MAITAADLFDSTLTASGITDGVKNIKVVGGGENTEYQLRFLMFRPDLAELEMGGAQGAGLGGR